MDTQSSQIPTHNYYNILSNNEVIVEDNPTMDNSSSFTVNKQTQKPGATNISKPCEDLFNICSCNAHYVSLKITSIKDDVENIILICTL